MANKARGETTIDVPKVGKVTLCLTMEAMAQLEDDFECDNLQDVMTVMAGQPSSRNLAKVLYALTLDKHEGEFEVEQIRRWKISPFIIREAMGAMNAANEDAAGNEPEEKPTK